MHTEIGSYEKSEVINAPEKKENALLISAVLYVQFVIMLNTNLIQQLTSKGNFFTIPF